MKNKVKKAVVLLTAASMVMASGCGGSSAKETETAKSEGESSEGIRKYEGTTLYMIAEQQTPTIALESQLDDFEELTGIKVDLQMAPFDDVVQKETLAFESKTGAYDIVAAPYQFLGNMVDNEYIQSIEPFMEDESLAVIPDYDSDDIIKAMSILTGKRREAAPRLAQPPGK